MLLCLIVERNRREYDLDVVPIFVLMDKGFYGEKLFKTSEWLKIGNLFAGKLYRNVIDAANVATD